MKEWKFAGTNGIKTVEVRLDSKLVPLRRRSRARLEGVGGSRCGYGIRVRWWDPSGAKVSSSTLLIRMLVPLFVRSGDKSTYGRMAGVPVGL